MKLLKKWWFWIILLIVVVVLYFVLGRLGITPTYQCGSTMGEGGPVGWCYWSRGKLAG